MIESPFLQGLLADPEAVRNSPGGRALVTQATLQTTRDNLVQFLQARFGAVPTEVAEAVNVLADEAKLRDLITQAGRCPDLASFRAHLSA